jgi:sacsin
VFLLQSKWFGAEAAAGGGGAGGFAAQQLQVLRSLPVYEVHAPLAHEDEGASLQQHDSAAAAAAAAAGVRTWVSLSASGTAGSSHALLLAPDGISSAQVLGARFLRCESVAEEQVLQRHLGVQRLSMVQFVSAHLATAPQQLEPRALISTLAFILRNLQQLCVAEPSLPSVMRTLPIIPTRSSSSDGTTTNTTTSASSSAVSRPQLRLAPPSALFDPHNSTFQQLLEPRHFPAPPFDGSTAAGAGAADAQLLLQSLTLCGLCTTVSLDVLVLAARSIAQHPADAPEPHGRAQRLLQCFDCWAQQHPQPSVAEAALWRELQSIAWCPVLLSPPDAALPWPHKRNAAAGSEQQEQQGQQHQQQQHAADAAAGGQESVAESSAAAVQQQVQVLRMPPKMVAPADMAWLVSAPLRLLAAPAPPSTELAQLLGWQRQQVLRPPVVIAQLVALGEAYPAAPAGAPAGALDAALQDRLAAAAGQLYDSLAACVRSGSEQQELIETTMAGTACVWTGAGFAFPAVCALELSPQQAGVVTPAAAASSAATDAASDAVSPGDAPAAAGAAGTLPLMQQEQLLWVVPASLLEAYSGAATTLAAARVPRQWDFGAWALALAVLGERSAGRPLTQHELRVTLAAADCAASALLAGAGSTRQLQQPGVMAAAASLLAAAAGAGRPVAAASGPDLLLLPDAEAVMAPPAELFFNDASWLADKAEGLRFAHEGLSQATAEALGVRSMRWQHQEGQQLASSIGCCTAEEAASAAAALLGSVSTWQPEPAAQPATADGQQAPAPALSLLDSPAAAAAEGPAHAVLSSILRWADQLCATEASRGRLRSSGDCGAGGPPVARRDVSFSVVLDERQHGTQSLLHAGLCKQQGAACAPSNVLCSGRSVRLRLGCRRAWSDPTMSLCLKPALCALVLLCCRRTCAMRHAAGHQQPVQQPARAADGGRRGRARAGTRRPEACSSSSQCR